MYTQVNYVCFHSNVISYYCIRINLLLYFNTSSLMLMMCYWKSWYRLWKWSSTII